MPDNGALPAAPSCPTALHDPNDGSPGRESQPLRAPATAAAGASRVSPIQPPAVAHSPATARPENVCVTVGSPQQPAPQRDIRVSGPASACRLPAADAEPDTLSTLVERLGATQAHVYLHAAHTGPASPMSRQQAPPTTRRRGNAGAPHRAAPACPSLEALSASDSSRGSSGESNPTREAAGRGVLDSKAICPSGRPGEDGGDSEDTDDNVEEEEEDGWESDGWPSGDGDNGDNDAEPEDFESEAWVERVKELKAVCHGVWVHASLSLQRSRGLSLCLVSLTRPYPDDLPAVLEETLRSLHLQAASDDEAYSLRFDDPSQPSATPLPPLLAGSGAPPLAAGVEEAALPVLACAVLSEVLHLVHQIQDALQGLAEEEEDEEEKDAEQAAEDELWQAQLYWTYADGTFCKALLNVLLAPSWSAGADESSEWDDVCALASEALDMLMCTCSQFGDAQLLEAQHQQMEAALQRGTTAALRAAERMRDGWEEVWGRCSSGSALDRAADVSLFQGKFLLPLVSLVDALTNSKGEMRVPCKRGAWCATMASLVCLLEFQLTSCAAPAGGASCRQERRRHGRQRASEKTDAAAPVTVAVAVTKALESAGDFSRRLLAVLSGETLEVGRAATAAAVTDMVLLIATASATARLMGRALCPGGSNQRAWADAAASATTEGAPAEAEAEAEEGQAQGKNHWQLPVAHVMVSRLLDFIRQPQWGARVSLAHESPYRLHAAQLLSTLLDAEECRDCGYDSGAGGSGSASASGSSNASGSGSSGRDSGRSGSGSSSDRGSSKSSSSSSSSSGGGGGDEKLSGDISNFSWFLAALETQEADKEAPFMLGGLVELVAAFASQNHRGQVLEHPMWLQSAVHILLRMSEHQSRGRWGEQEPPCMAPTGASGPQEADLGALLEATPLARWLPCGQLPEAWHLRVWEMGMGVYHYLCHAISRHAQRHRHQVAVESRETVQEALACLVGPLEDVLRLLARLATSPVLDETVSMLDVVEHLQLLPLEVLGAHPGDQLWLPATAAAAAALLDACCGWGDLDEDARLREQLVRLFESEEERQRSCSAPPLQRRVLAASPTCEPTKPRPCSAAAPGKLPLEHQWSVAVPWPTFLQQVAPLAHHTPEALLMAVKDTCEAAYHCAVPPPDATPAQSTAGGQLTASMLPGPCDASGGMEGGAVVPEWRLCVRMDLSGPREWRRHLGNAAWCQSHRDDIIPFLGELGLEVREYVLRPYWAMAADDAAAGLPTTPASRERLSRLKRKVELQCVAAVALAHMVRQRPLVGAALLVLDTGSTAQEARRGAPVPPAAEVALVDALVKRLWAVSRPDGELGLPLVVCRRVTHSCVDVLQALVDCSEMGRQRVLRLVQDWPTGTGLLRFEG